MISLDVPVDFEIYFALAAAVASLAWTVWQHFQHKKHDSNHAEIRDKCPECTRHTPTQEAPPQAHSKPRRKSNAKDNTKPNQESDSPYMGVKQDDQKADPKPTK